MKAGRLRHRAKIQQVTETTNSHGDTIQAWADFATIDAEIVPQESREFFRAKQVQADITHLLRTRYVPGVTPEMRVALGSRVLHIESTINVEERNIELLLICRERL